jgi:hypothetical protein
MDCRTKLALATVLAAAAAAVAPAGASAAVTRCSGDQYQLIQRGGLVSIERLRTVGLPRRTDGYAPRCLVAEALASDVQGTYERSGRIPRRIRLFGARWNGGTWTVRAKREGQEAHTVTARRGRAKIAFFMATG